MNRIADAHYNPLTPAGTIRPAKPGSAQPRRPKFARKNLQKRTTSGGPSDAVPKIDTHAATRWRFTLTWTPQDPIALRLQPTRGTDAWTAARCPARGAYLNR